MLSGHRTHFRHLAHAQVESPGILGRHQGVPTHGGYLISHRRTDGDVLSGPV